MTGPQRDTALRFVPEFATRFGVGKFRHGDCLGVDVQLAVMAQRSGFWTVAHPPVKSKYRAYHESNEVLEPDDYLRRDRAIVDDSDYMIAFPSTYDFVPRSGTWYTINYAIAMSVPVGIVLPDGSIRSASSDVSALQEPRSNQ